MKKVEIDFNLSVSDGTSTSFITEGSYDIKDKVIVLNFIEETLVKANTYVYIYEDKVIIDRNGSIKMKMEYIMGTDTICNLTTDFDYQLSMNNYTSYLEINDTSIRIVYQTEMDKEQNLTHNLDLKWYDIN